MNDLHNAKNVEQVRWLEDMYLYLMATTRNSGGPCQGIRVPETVVLKYQRPSSFVYMASDGTLCRNTEVRELNAEKLTQTFASFKGQLSEISCYYVSQKKNEKGRMVSTIEYFSLDGFENFLLRRPKENNGIIQRFIDPPPPNNMMIHVQWTPHKLNMEQRININSLSDTRVSMNERAITFDGPPHLSRVFPLKSPKLKRKVNEMLNAIITHINKVLPHGYKVWEIELYFKVSSKNKIYLLWCNNCRVVDKPPNPDVYHPPLDTTAVSPHLFVGRHLLPNFFTCPSCLGIYDKKQHHAVQYRYVLLHNMYKNPPDLAAVRAQLEEGMVVKREKRSVRDHWKEQEDMEKFIRPGCEPHIFRMVKFLGIGESGKAEQMYPVQGGPVTRKEFAWFKEHLLIEENFLSKEFIVCDQCCYTFNLSADREMAATRSSLLSPADTGDAIRRPPGTDGAENYPSPREGSPSFFSRRPRTTIGGRTVAAHELLKVAESPPSRKGKKSVDDVTRFLTPPAKVHKRKSVQPTEKNILNLKLSFYAQTNSSDEDSEPSTSTEPKKPSSAGKSKPQQLGATATTMAMTTTSSSLLPRHSRTAKSGRQSAPPDLGHPHFDELHPNDLLSTSLNNSSISLNNNLSLLTSSKNSSPVNRLMTAPSPSDHLSPQNNVRLWMRTMYGREDLLGRVDSLLSSTISLRNKQARAPPYDRSRSPGTFALSTLARYTTSSPPKSADNQHSAFDYLPGLKMRN